MSCSVMWCGIVTSREITIICNFIISVCGRVTPTTYTKLLFSIWLFVKETITVNLIANSKTASPIFSNFNSLIRYIKILSYFQFALLFVIEYDSCKFICGNCRDTHLTMSINLFRILVKKLRYYARFLVVSIMVNKMDLVLELKSVSSDQVTSWRAFEKFEFSWLNFICCVYRRPTSHYLGTRSCWHSRRRLPAISCYQQLSAASPTACTTRMYWVSRFTRPKFSPQKKSFMFYLT